MVLRFVFAASAASRVTRASRCQNVCVSASSPTGLFDSIQHPTSCVRSLTGRHTPPETGWPSACVQKITKRLYNVRHPILCTSFLLRFALLPEKELCRISALRHTTRPVLCAIAAHAGRLGPFA